MNAHEQISSPDGLRRFASEWLGVSVGSGDAAKWAAAARQHKERWDTATGPFVWVKNRVLEAGLIPFGWEPFDDRRIVTAVLHIGFLSLSETSEMVARLPEATQLPSDSTARSRLVGEMAIRSVSPIDGTAAKVFGGDQ
jgi:hypothetical protein